VLDWLLGVAVSCEYQDKCEYLTGEDFSLSRLWVTLVLELILQRRPCGHPNSLSTLASVVDVAPALVHR